MLCIKSVTDSDSIYPLDGFKFSLGSAKECDIVIENSMLNDIHALLWVAKDFVTVMTVQDAVITVNGELVVDRISVKIGETISFADLEMVVAELAETHSETPQAGPSETDWMLISRNQEMKGQKIVIEGECSIGRAKDNTICIPVISLSRHHATLRIGDKGLHLEDQQSANGTFVNGKQVGAEAVKLQRGDIIAFDALEFLVHGPEDNIHSEQTSVRPMRQAAFAARAPIPTAIDRQKVSIVQHKPETFTQKFQAIQEKQVLARKIEILLLSPSFWLWVTAGLVAVAAIIFATS